MRRAICTLLFILAVAAAAVAQTSVGNTHEKMAFKTFQPAIVTKPNGKTVAIKQANIFYKNSRLLYKQGNSSLEVSLDDIKSVDIQGRHYVRVDSVLAYVVDTVGSAKLLCATVIDIPAYITQLKNNREVSYLEIGTMVSYNSVTLDPDADDVYPLVNYYYYDLNGKVIRAEERTLSRNIDKSKRRMMKTIMSMPNFAWGDPQSLMTMLKAVF